MARQTANGGEHISLDEAIRTQFDEWETGKSRAFVAVRYPASINNPYNTICKWLRKQAEDGRCSYHIERRGKLVAHIVRRP